MSEIQIRSYWSINREGQLENVGNQPIKRERTIADTAIKPVEELTSIPPVARSIKAEPADGQPPARGDLWVNDLATGWNVVHESTSEPFEPIQADNGNKQPITLPKKGRPKKKGKKVKKNPRSPYKDAGSNEYLKQLGFLCPHCEFTTVNKAVLRRHIRSHELNPNEKNLYACKECSFSCPSAGRLRQHELTHSSECKYQCEDCDYKTKWRNNLAKHERTHTGERPYGCSCCEYKAADYTTLKRHYRVHSKEDDGGKVNQRSGEMRKKSIRPSGTNVQRKKRDDKVWAPIDLIYPNCELPSQTQVHEAPESLGSKFESPVVPEKIVKKAARKLSHIPYECFHCGFRTRRFRKLKDHIAAHIGEDPYAFTSLVVCEYNPSSSPSNHTSEVQASNGSCFDKLTDQPGGVYANESDQIGSYHFMDLEKQKDGVQQGSSSEVDRQMGNQQNSETEDHRKQSSPSKKSADISNENEAVDLEAEHADHQCCDCVEIKSEPPDSDLSDAPVIVPEEEQKRKRGRPRKDSLVATPEKRKTANIEKSKTNPADENSEPKESPKRGRPRKQSFANIKSREIAELEIVAETEHISVRNGLPNKAKMKPAEGISERKRRRGRSSTQEVVATSKNSDAEQNVSQCGTREKVKTKPTDTKLRKVASSELNGERRRGRSSNQARVAAAEKSERDEQIVISATEVTPNRKRGRPPTESISHKRRRVESNNTDESEDSPSSTESKRDGTRSGSSEKDKTISSDSKLREGRTKKPEGMQRRCSPRINSEVAASINSSVAGDLRKNKLKVPQKEDVLQSKISCEKCDFQTNSAAYLRRHLKNHDLAFSCTECPYTSRWPNNLYKHMRTHTGERPYACTQCEFRASDYTTMKKHVLRVTSNYGSLEERHRMLKMIREKYDRRLSRKRGADNSERNAERCSEVLSNSPARHLRSRRAVTDQIATAIHENRDARQNLHAGSSNGESNKQIPLDKKHLGQSTKSPEAVAEKNFKPVKVKTTKRLNVKTPRKFACTTCVFTTNSKFLWLGHLQTHLPQSFACKTCDFKSKSASGLKLHMEAHDNLYSCKKCVYRTKWKHIVIKHIKKKHLGKTRFTPTTGKAISSYYTIEKMHDTYDEKVVDPNSVRRKRGRPEKGEDEKSPSASYTENKSSDTSQKKRMLSNSPSMGMKLVKRGPGRPKKEGDKLQKLPNKHEESPNDTSKIPTKSGRRVLRSSPIGLEEMPYLCYHCKFQTRKMRILKRHMLTHPSEEWQVDNNPGGGELRSSDDKPVDNNLDNAPISKSELSNRKIKQEMETSAFSQDAENIANEDKTKVPKLDKKTQKLRTHSCKICKYETASNSQMKQHMKMHRKKLPFACKECPYKSNWLTNLVKHVRTHTGEKPYECAKCKFKASDYTTLKKHTKIHGRGDPVERLITKNFGKNRRRESDKVEESESGSSSDESVELIIPSPKKPRKSDAEVIDYRKKPRRTIVEFIIASPESPESPKKSDRSTESVGSPRKTDVESIKEKLISPNADQRTPMDYQLNSSGELAVTPGRYSFRNARTCPEISYECYHCDFRTRRKRILKRHAASHIGDATAIEPCASLRSLESQAGIVSHVVLKNEIWGGESSNSQEHQENGLVRKCKEETLEVESENVVIESENSDFETEFLYIGPNKVEAESEYLEMNEESFVVLTGNVDAENSQQVDIDVKPYWCISKDQMINSFEELEQHHLSHTEELPPSEIGDDVVDPSPIGEPVEGMRINYIVAPDVESVVPFEFITADTLQPL